ncbi:hypothetical protein DSL72_000455 [Monilinia vaccinii-corymbosi]|uniref:Uncharacterized protein n=1 Tax=Monilinia vaccinii-corymbosi TaxID=61207 RepID=A0A8A3PAB8_9HELO|nr:hypothetical protein DSL72_000455 [Monilinia vaccinii-corymbosi]
METKIKGYGEKKVLERGLENVTRSDGGLTRSRLEKLDEDKGLGASMNFEVTEAVVGLDGEEMVPSSASSSSGVSRVRGKKKSMRSTMMNERKIRRIIQNSSTPQEEIGLLKDAAKMGVVEDGNADDSTHSHSDTEPADFGQPEPCSSSSPSDIYVSIYDPAGGAFIPSKTKPLPKWMSLLPNNVQREREESHGDSRGDLSQQAAGAAVSGATLQDSYADGASSIHWEGTGEHSLHTPCPTEERGSGLSTKYPSGNVTPRDKCSPRNRTNSNSDNTSPSTRRPSTIQSHSTISSLITASPYTKAKNTTTRPRSVSIEEKLPRPHQHPASAYRRATRSSTIESTCVEPSNPNFHGSLNVQEGIQVVQALDHPPRDVSERPLTPYPKNDDFFQANVLEFKDFRVPETSMLTSQLSHFITPRKGSCCGLSASLESAGIGELKKRDRGKSSFDSTFESFPIPEIGKNNSNYATSLSPKLGVLGIGTEYLERYGMLPGREKGEGRDGGGEKEGIVEKIRRQRVGPIRLVFFFFPSGFSILGVCLGQVAQNVKEEKERRRAETQNQPEWEWMEIEGKGRTAEDRPQFRSRGRSRRRLGVVSEANLKEAEAKPPMSSRRSSRRRVTSEGASEERGNLISNRSRNGDRKGKERERRDVKGKGKSVEEDLRPVAETEDCERSKREKLKRELRGLVWGGVSER